MDSESSGKMEMSRSSLVGAAVLMAAFFGIARFEETGSPYAPKENANFRLIAPNGTAFDFYDRDQMFDWYQNPDAMNLEMTQFLSEVCSSPIHDKVVPVYLTDQEFLSDPNELGATHFNSVGDSYIDIFVGKIRNQLRENGQVAINSIQGSASNEESINLKKQVDVANDGFVHEVGHVCGGDKGSAVVDDVTLSFDKRVESDAPFFGYKFAKKLLEGTIGNLFLGKAVKK